MRRIKKNINKEDFDEIFGLYSKQPWLCDKEDSLIELILLCQTKEHKSLIVDLLKEFNYLDQKVFGNYLNLLADYIIEDSGFNEDTCQIASITYDDEADSSQKILDNIKMPLFQQGWSNIKTVNRFGAIPKNFKDGKHQVMLVDEFVGSGQTILGRIKQLKNDIKDPSLVIKLCFIAGMDLGIKRIENEGYEVFCPLRLPKGISERFKGSKLVNALEIMTQLEQKLCTKINHYELKDYSFGYNEAEALYSLESCLGNTPNSVFPIFWWPRDITDKSRTTMLTRFEKGLK
ncbi:hypothetical protein [Myroides sp. WP-1]|uniref:phosphoribosyltransferase-like protein n=1 Tax=Myroides sp. WP-1 TaxID=2759944 RepID=UPI0015FB7EA8|nr:hypothetical protein [Myroides sp. WP-1]MBB1140899.1 hypothetical protein [Myroides sp. WP-1]